jgi:hypothetical protein
LSDSLHFLRLKEGFPSSIKREAGVSLFCNIPRDFGKADNLALALALADRVDDDIGPNQPLC